MRVGILGCGQLGQMLSLSGAPLGHEFFMYDPSTEKRYDSLNARRQGIPCTPAEFAANCDVLTYESENTSVALLASLKTPVYPPLAALEAAQHRVREKTLFRSLEIPTAPFYVIEHATDAKAASNVAFPLILKTSTLGYDGKGQVLVKDGTQLEAAWQSLGKQPCIAERLVDFQRELSIIGCRDLDGNTVFYPLTENIHHAGILRISIAPAQRSIKLQAIAQAYVQRLFDATNYCGVLSLELFETNEGLIANEMAPRVHNSGHWTTHGNSCSQFENHVRAITGLPLGQPHCMAEAIAMINFIGSLPSLTPLLSKPHYHVHLYGKEARPHRK